MIDPYAQLSASLDRMPPEHRRIYRVTVTEDQERIERKRANTRRGQATYRAKSTSWQKIRARWRLQNAIRRGRLERLPCEVCGAKAQAHHDDYSKPLDVRWLCKLHHEQVHHSSP